MLLLQFSGCFLGTVCGNVDQCVTEAPSDCASAIANGAGEPDACDVAACETCVDNCGSGCAVLESFPPVYSCGGQGGSWDVYAMCPDWQPPGDIYATDVTEAGCPTTGAHDPLVASAATPGRIEVCHDGALSGCCPQEIAVHVVAGTQTLDLSYTGVNDFCECTGEIDVSYALEGVPAGEWTLTAGVNGDSATVTVD